MSYRFVKVTSYYKEYLKDYYRRNPNIVRKTYAEQMQHIMSEGFGWADFFATHLRNLGVDAYEIIATALPLQQAWAREQGIKASGKDIVIAQLKALQPDVVFLQDSFRFNGAWVTHLREQVPSIKQVIGWCAAPCTDENLQQFKVFDYILTCHPGYYQEFTERGLRMHRMNHAIESSLLPKISCSHPSKDIDCIFMGSLATGEGFHSTRIKMLEKLVESNIKLNIYGAWLNSNLVKYLLKQGAYVAAKPLKAVGLSNLAKELLGWKAVIGENPHTFGPRYSKVLNSVLQPPLYGIDMLKVLSCAKVGLNFHIDASGRYAGNIRLYEVTGVGSCLLTDWKENLHELFEIDTEVVTYKSADECLEKAKWLLEHPKEREAIAKAGQARTLRDHTYEKRALQLDSIIHKGFKNL
ncbi:MAG: glycosyltransferase [Microcoleus vaginatus WJT46-NPBG5]|jgi:hypothetical protein|nr:glycosyltransferase [Microcoleus vaginatus WJT46-NPBG5]